jgi:tRNA threonylcarbamoyl adenosine modification protein (Sua5/YciO/YrdC/YwlC family)
VIISIHPQNPQARQIQRVIEILKKGGVVAYPTDTLFGIGCDVTCPGAIDTIARLKGKNKATTFSFLCKDFQQADLYVKISQQAFRIMKHVLPGPYTFILPATSYVPKKIFVKRKTVGIRIPDHLVCRALIEALGNPIANTSIETEEDTWAGDAYSVEEMIGHQMDAVIDGGECDMLPSTVIDLTDDTPVVLRKGKGDISFL